MKNEIFVPQEVIEDIKKWTIIDEIDEITRMQLYGVEVDIFEDLDYQEEREFKEREFKITFPNTYFLSKNILEKIKTVSFGPFNYKFENDNIDIFEDLEE